MRVHHVCTLLAALALLTIPIARAPAHEGHDHAAAPALVKPAAPRAEAASEAFELVAVRGRGELVLYLDRFGTNEPVGGAAIALETPHGSVEAVSHAEGSYRVAAPWAATPGRYDLIATVTAGGVSDVLILTLDIPPPATASGGVSASALSGSAFALASGNPVSSADANGVGLLLVAFGAGLAGGLLLARRRRALLPVLLVASAALLSGPASSHEGEDHGASDPPAPAPSARTASAAASAFAARDVAQALPDGSVFIPKETQRVLAIRTAIAAPASHRRVVELPGRIIPDPDFSGYVQTAVGGRLSPPEGGFPRLGTRVRKGDVLAYVTPPLQAIDVSDLRQRQGELNQQIAIVERRLARFETLAPSGAVARSQLEETRLELHGLKERRAALDRSRREPEALLAPVDGVVAEGNPVAGQIAQTNAVVFHIIEPARLWVEALSYDPLPPARAASASVGGRELRLAYRGAGLADRNQAVPAHFAVEGDASGLRPGQFVTVLAETAQERRGLALPRASVVRSASGQDAVYAHVAAERFEPRAVRVEPLDGARVLVSHGLAPGARVVVQGAELIGHIR